MDHVQSEPARIEERTATDNELSDRELVAEVLRKDRKATAEFIGRHADCVYAYVQRRLIPRHELVDDLVQEIFLSAWENLDKFRGDAPLRNWLLGIARHKVEDHYRLRLREVQLPEEEGISQGEPTTFYDAEELLAEGQASRRTWEILASLPEIYGVILLWRYWEERSLREIAGQTGRTEKAIERLLARARHQFKKRWNERP
jgi:RNA polymerase sigma-70 factor, ECF subfamily